MMGKCTKLVLTEIDGKCQGEFGDMLSLPHYTETCVSITIPQLRNQHDILAHGVHDTVSFRDAAGQATAQRMPESLGFARSPERLQLNLTERSFIRRKIASSCLCEYRLYSQACPATMCFTPTTPAPPPCLPRVRTELREGRARG